MDLGDGPAGGGRGNEGVRRGERRIGRILVEAGRLGEKDAGRVLEFAGERGLLFGEAARQMGLVKSKDVRFALAEQFSFPHLAEDDDSLSRDVVAAYDPSHPLSEQLRGMRARILSLASDGKRKSAVMAIVSSDRGDGRSFVAANLAVTLAQTGLRTLLIDADLRNPGQHGYFKLSNRKGLSTVLSSRAGAEATQSVARFPNLKVLTAGPRPPNSLELLENPQFELLLGGADATFSAVVIDTSAGAEGADASLIARRAGAAVLVSRSNHTRAGTSSKFLKSLTAERAKLIGVVFNGG
jgi:chain length determinant protein tyrosine kinase EpsG